MSEGGERERPLTGESEVPTVGSQEKTSAQSSRPMSATSTWALFVGPTGCYCPGERQLKQGGVRPCRHYRGEINARSTAWVRVTTRTDPLRHIGGRVEQCSWCGTMLEWVQARFGAGEPVAL